MIHAIPFLDSTPALSRQILVSHAGLPDGTQRPVTIEQPTG